MAGADKLTLGLDDIIRSDPSANRRGRGAGGGSRGFRGRGGRGGGNGFRTRGGGGIVSMAMCVRDCHLWDSFSLAHSMRRSEVVGTMTSMRTIPTAIEGDNAMLE